MENITIEVPKSVKAEFAKQAILKGLSQKEYGGSIITEVMQKEKEQEKKK